MNGKLGRVNFGHYNAQGHGKGNKRLRDNLIIILSSYLFASRATSSKQISLFQSPIIGECFRSKVHPKALH